MGRVVGVFFERVARAVDCDVGRKVMDDAGEV